MNKVQVLIALITLKKLNERLQCLMFSLSNSKYNYML